MKQPPSGAAFGSALPDRFPAALPATLPDFPPGGQPCRALGLGERRGGDGLLVGERPHRVAAALRGQRGTRHVVGGGPAQRTAEAANEIPVDDPVRRHYPLSRCRTTDLTCRGGAESYTSGKA